MSVGAKWHNNKKYKQKARSFRGPTNRYDNNRNKDTQYDPDIWKKCTEKNLLIKYVQNYDIKNSRGQIR